MLGMSEPMQWKKHFRIGIIIVLSTIPFDKLPCDWVWTFKLVNVLPSSVSGSLGTGTTTTTAQPMLAKPVTSTSQPILVKPVNVSSVSGTK